MISNIEVTKRAHISRRKYDTIYKCFVEDISKIVNVNRNTARVRSKRSRGAGSKIIVFGLFKRGDKIYTGIVNSVKSKELSPIIKKVVGTGSDIIY